MLTIAMHSASGSFMISARDSYRGRGRRNSHRRQREHSSLALYLEIIFARELRQGLTDFDASEPSHPELELELASSSARSDERDCVNCVCQAQRDNQVE
jgi:hypothetical protein